ncbi:hypothetical protein O3680_12955 [Prevotella melaninogenica]|uniref:hypothetical protein n=1 Tax=Prevotella melaninogenica TaxID=28132 RepID=UPI00352DD083
MEVEVKDGQTLADIAIQEYGSLEALPALAAANGIGMAETLAAGSRLQLPDVSFNRLIQQVLQGKRCVSSNREGYDGCQVKGVRW